MKMITRIGNIGNGCAAIVMSCAIQGGVLCAQTTGNGPVFVAALTGNITAMKAFVTGNPAVVELYDQYGKTPLHYAVCGSNQDLIAYLLANGASVATRDNRGWTALHYAADSSDDPKIANMLICFRPGRQREYAVQHRRRAQLPHPERLPLHSNDAGSKRQLP